MEVGMWHGVKVRLLAAGAIACIGALAAGNAMLAGAALTPALWALMSALALWPAREAIDATLVRWERSNESLLQLCAHAVHRTVQALRARIQREMYRWIGRWMKQPLYQLAKYNCMTKWAARFLCTIFMLEPPPPAKSAARATSCATARLEPACSESATVLARAAHANPERDTPCEVHGNCTHVTPVCSGAGAFVSAAPEKEGVPAAHGSLSPALNLDDAPGATGAAATVSAVLPRAAPALDNAPSFIDSHAVLHDTSTPCGHEVPCAHAADKSSTPVAVVDGQQAALRSPVMRSPSTTLRRRAAVDTPQRTYSRSSQRSALVLALEDGEQLILTRLSSPPTPAADSNDARDAPPPPSAATLPWTLLAVGYLVYFTVPTAWRVLHVLFVLSVAYLTWRVVDFILSIGRIHRAILQVRKRVSERVQGSCVSLLLSRFQHWALSASGTCKVTFFAKVGSMKGTLIAVCLIAGMVSGGALGTAVVTRLLITEWKTSVLQVSEYIVNAAPHRHAITQLSFVESMVDPARWIHFADEHAASIRAAAQHGHEWIDQRWPDYSGPARDVWAAVLRFNATLHAGSNEPSGAGGEVVHNATLAQRSSVVDSPVYDLCVQLYHSFSKSGAAEEQCQEELLEQHASTTSETAWDHNLNATQQSVSEAVAAHTLHAETSFVASLPHIVQSMLFSGDGHETDDAAGTTSGSAVVGVHPIVTSLSSALGVDMLSNLWSTSQKVVQSTYAVGKAATSSLLAYAISTSASIVSFLLSVMLYFNLLFYLLSAERSWPERLLAVLPPGARRRVNQALEDTVRPIFKVNVQLALFHAAFTYLAFSVVNANFAVTASILAACAAVIPFFPVYLVPLTATLQVFLRHGSVPACAFFLVYSTVVSFVGYEILNGMGDAHPAVLGLSILAGMAAYGVQGAFLGPLLVGALVSVYSIVKEGMDARDAAPATHADSADSASQFSGSEMARERRGYTLRWRRLRVRRHHAACVVRPAELQVASATATALGGGAARDVGATVDANLA